MYKLQIKGLHLIPHYFTKRHKNLIEEEESLVINSIPLFNIADDYGGNKAAKKIPLSKRHFYKLQKALKFKSVASQPYKSTLFKIPS